MMPEIKCKRCRAPIWYELTDTAEYIVCGHCKAENDRPTNADRIRSMSDEELAIALHTAFTDGVVYCINGQRGDFSGAKKESDYLNWIQQPTVEDKP